MINCWFHANQFNNFLNEKKRFGYEPDINLEGIETIYDLLQLNPKIMISVHWFIIKIPEHYFEIIKNQYE